jgi:hypothetical protein
VGSFKLRRYFEGHSTPLTLSSLTKVGVLRVSTTDRRVAGAIRTRYLPPGNREAMSSSEAGIVVEIP